MPIQHGPRFGQDDAFRTARDQLPSQFGLQAGEMMADRGLRYMQLMRGAREAAGLDDPNEVTKLPQVHADLMFRRRSWLLQFARLFEARE
ncbi:MAG TPA: hypothetical protein VGM09_01540 [Bradyrhizobium sp.]